MAPLRAGLRVTVEFRWAQGNYDRLPAFAEELVRLNVDVLVSHGGGRRAGGQSHLNSPSSLRQSGTWWHCAWYRASRGRGGKTSPDPRSSRPNFTDKCRALIKEAVPSLTKVGHPRKSRQCRDRIRAPRGRGDCDGFEYRIASIRNAPAKRIRARLGCVRLVASAHGSSWH